MQGNKYSVKLISSSQFSEELLKSGDIYLISDQDDWNDFGYRSRGTFQLLKNDRVVKIEVLVGLILLKPLEENELSGLGIGNYFEETLKKFESLKKIPIEKFEYFTMFPNISSYRILISEFGISDSDEILKSLHDVVRLRKRSRRSKIYQYFLSSSLFGLSFMRDSESFFAYHNAGSILDGLQFESLAAVSNSLDLEFKLESFPNQHRVHFRFNHKGPIPRRVNFLIGKNGLGKSQTLNKLVLAALGKKNELLSFTDPTNEDQKFPMISRILAFGTPGETTNTFPSDKSKKKKIFYKKLDFGRSGREKTYENIGSLILQLLKPGGMIGEFSRYEIFLNSLSGVLPLEKIVLFSNDVPGNEVFAKISNLGVVLSEEKYLKKHHGIMVSSSIGMLSEDKILPLSSGQVAFFNAALMMCLYIENGSLVLFDEPETHLHPNLISDFYDLLNKLLSYTGSIAIVATHSPFFIREVFSDQVLVYQLNRNGGIVVGQPRIKTFGAEVGAISKYVFEDDVHSRLVQRLLLSFPDRRKLISMIQEDAADEIIIKLNSNISEGRL